MSDLLGLRHVFLSLSALCQDPVPIEDDAFHHLFHVLRAKEGEEIVLLDNLGGAFRARLVAVEKRRALAKVLGTAETLPEPSLRVTVAQAIGKGDRFEVVLQHGTELGASAFIPLLAERSNVRIEPASIPAKIERWRRIVKGAAEQTRRARIPVVLEPEALGRILAREGEFGERVLLEHGAEPLEAGSFAAENALLLVVGPEGGFSEAERAMALEAGLKRRSAGNYVLRTETAALAALARMSL